VELTEPQHRTVLFSTHITSDLERVADYVAIMKAGHIIYFDSLEELKDRTHLSLEEAYLEMLNKPQEVQHR
jgi:ABC-2 type transport system ATP-binding protein